jgi:phosphoglycolate phosphatase-like HAD superfamily hydrolase
LFTGRTRHELHHTLDGREAHDLFRRVVTMDDVTKGKPDPEGLRMLLDGMSPRQAVYLGDSLDDALAAKRARVPFLGILPTGSDAHRFRSARLHELGALAILHNVTELEKFWE